MLAGDDTWKTGEVVKLWYRDDDTFEDGYVVPYQVLLDDGDLNLHRLMKTIVLERQIKSKRNHYGLMWEIWWSAKLTVVGFLG